MHQESIKEIVLILHFADLSFIGKTPSDLKKLLIYYIHTVIIADQKLMLRKQLKQLCLEKDVSLLLERDSYIMDSKLEDTDQFNTLGTLFSYTGYVSLNIEYLIGKALNLLLIIAQNLTSNQGYYVTICRVCFVIFVRSMGLHEV